MKGRWGRRGESRGIKKNFEGEEKSVKKREGEQTRETHERMVKKEKYESQVEGKDDGKGKRNRGE